MLLVCGVRISWNSAEASRQCCLCSLGFCFSARDPSGLMVRTLTSIQKVLGSNPSWILYFFRGFISHSFNKNIIIHECLLSLTIRNIKPLNFTNKTKTAAMLDYIEIVGSMAISANANRRPFECF